MNNEELILSIDKKLKINFYSFFLVLILFCVLILTVYLPIQKLDAALSVNLQRVLIVALLAGIPGGLVWAKDKMKELESISSIPIRLNLYKKYVLIRQYIFITLGFLSLAMHVLTVMKGALMLFAVVVLLCAFIAPSRSRMEAEAYLINPEVREEEKMDDPEENS